MNANKIRERSRLRFEEEDKLFLDKLQAVIRTTQAGGARIIGLFNVLKGELPINSDIIVRSIVDTLRESKSICNREDAASLATELLNGRKSVLEDKYAHKTKVIFSKIQNTKMHEQYTSLDSTMSHATDEMKVSLTRELDKYEAELGGTLTDIIKNRLKNRPVLAVMIVVFGAIIFIAAVIGAIDVINNFSK